MNVPHLGLGYEEHEATWARGLSRVKHPHMSLALHPGLLLTWHHWGWGAVGGIPHHPPTHPPSKIGRNCLTGSRLIKTFLRRLWRQLLCIKNHLEQRLLDQAEAWTPCMGQKLCTVEGNCAVYTMINMPYGTLIVTYCSGVSLLYGPIPSKSSLPHTTSTKKKHNSTPGPWKGP